MNTYSDETLHMNTNEPLGSLNKAIYLPNKRRGILMVEDGSVDIDALEKFCEEVGGIKVLVYRSGSQKPELVWIDEEPSLLGWTSNG